MTRKPSDSSGAGGNDRPGGPGSAHLRAARLCEVLSQSFCHSLALGPASESLMKLQGHFVSLFLCTWPRRLGELSASGEADPGWKGLDSGGGGPRRRSCVGANMYAKGEASVEPLTLTHQPHRVIQGTPSWAEGPGGGLEACDILSKPPHALPGWRVLEPREGENTVAVTFPPPGALGAASLQGLGCSDSILAFLPLSLVSALPPTPTSKTTRLQHW